MEKPTWDEFSGKNSGRKNDTFEALARLLFRTRYELGDSLPYFKNHPGNETATIQNGEEIIGFQAKFFENGKINPDEILKSLVKVEKKQTKQIIYTNAVWGNPQKSRNKTEGQIKIENKAQEIGIELEWLYGDNILDLVQKNQLAYDVFFNLKSNLNHLQKDVDTVNEDRLKSIETSFTIGDKSVSIDRSCFVDKLDELIVKGQNVLIAGESGTGKSAIVKMYYEKYHGHDDHGHDDHAFYIINAGQLNTKAVNDLFSLQENYTLTGFRDYFKGTEHKILVIDSAEKIIELTDGMPLISLITGLDKEGWNFVFTCRENAQAKLMNFLNKKYFLTANPVNVNVNRISDDELKKISAEYGIELPNDLKLMRQIHIPFFLARYCELSVSGQLNLKTFREDVWQKKVNGVGSESQQLKREHCLIEIVKQQLKTGAYYIDYSKDYESATYLVSSDILGRVPHKGFFVNHDIYVDWALDYILDKDLSDKNKVLKMLNTSKPTFRYVNAFKRWYAECIEEKSTEVTYIGDMVFSNHIDERWTDAIMECIGSSTEAAVDWFVNHTKELEDDNYKLFNHFVDIICVSCKHVWTTFKFEGMEYPITKPVGSGWEEAAKFIDCHVEDYYMNNLKTVYNFLSNFYNYKNAKGEQVKLGGKLALRIFQVIAETRQKGEDFWMERDSKWSQLVCQYAIECRVELQQIFDDVVDKHWIHNGDAYHELVKYVVKSGYPTNSTISMCCYHQIIRLLDTLWREQPEEEDGYPFHYRHIENSENAFGLNEYYAYFPSSAFQTPILSLLNAENLIKNNNDATLSFIINFMNYAVEKYSKSNYANVDTDTITVTLHNGSKHSVIANEPLWCLYRGTSSPAMPNMLECMHMALESHLLKLLENKDDEKRFEKVRSLFWRIFNESNSASLYAVVASVAMSDIDEFKDELLFLMQDIRFLNMDWLRYKRELLYVHSLLFEYDGPKQLWEERKKENSRKHRQYHLENVLLRMQVIYFNRSDDEGKLLLAKCQDVVRKLKEQVATIPKEQLSFENFIIARVDYASMQKEVVTLANGQKAVQMTPVHTPEMTEESNLMMKISQEFSKIENLRFWVSKRNEGDLKAIKDNPYELNLCLVIDTIRKTMLQVDKDGLPMNNVMNGSLPSMASSVLLMQLAEKLTEAQKAECRKYLFDALSHPEFQFRSPLPDFKVTILGFPALLDMKDKREQLQDILITYAEIHEDITNTRPCDNVRFMIDKYNLWDEHEDFMKETLAKYQQKLPNGDFNAMDSNQAVTILSLLTITPKNRKLGNLCIEKMTALWIPNEYSHNQHVKDTYIDSYIVSEYILRSPREEVSQLINPFVPYIKGGNDYNPLISAFVAKASEIGAYSNFWIVWNALYDNIVKSENVYLRYNSQMLNDYMINPTYLTKIGDDWFHLEEKDVAFYARIARDLPHYYTTLYAISRVFTTIGKKYVKQIIPVLASFVDGFTFHEKNISDPIIFNLEKMTMSMFTNYTNDINRNKDLHDQVVKILEFMKNNGSSRAADYLKLV